MLSTLKRPAGSGSHEQAESLTVVPCAYEVTWLPFRQRYVLVGSYRKMFECSFSVDLWRELNSVGGS